MKNIIAILLSLLCLPAMADCLSSRLHGVNLAGAEFNGSQLPGVIYKNFTYPGTATLDYFRKKGVNLIRLPILWERYQPKAYGALDATNMKQLKTIVAYAKKYDMCIWVDLHNYAKYHSQPLTAYSNPDKLLYDFWQRLHKSLILDERYWAYGLMNEPAAVSRRDWVNIAKSVVSRLRESDVTGLVIVSGGNWSGAHSWFANATEPSNAELLADLTDPLSRLAIDIHQYADSDASGTKTDCMDPSKMKNILFKVQEWAKSQNHRLLLGEFGVAAKEDCLNVLSSMLEQMSQPQWLGWTYWAAGSWWGSYPFSIQPTKDGLDQPQMTVVERYL